MLIDRPESAIELGHWPLQASGRFSAFNGSIFLSITITIVYVSVSFASRAFPKAEGNPGSTEAAPYEFFFAQPPFPNQSWIDPLHCVLKFAPFVKPPRPQRTPSKGHPPPGDRMAGAKSYQNYDCLLSIARQGETMRSVFFAFSHFFAKFLHFFNPRKLSSSKTAMPA